MSGLAKIFLELGYTVSGSDTKETQITKHLHHKGAIIYKGHKKNQIYGADLVIFSSAIKNSNPEIRQAKKRKVPLIARGKLVAQIINPKKSIIVAGTHGKTTTTALIAELLLNTGKDPSIFMGGILKKIGSNSRLGKSSYVVVESDESDASFLHFHPDIAVVTNVEDDHLDFYGSSRNIVYAFIKFMHQVKPQGTGALNLDDAASSFIFKKVKREKILTYGLNKQADIRAEDIKLQVFQSSFKVYYKKNYMGELTVPLPGMHNVYNSLAATATGYLLGISWTEIKNSLCSFEGVKRRIEKVGEIGQVPVFDDYAHHPTEIKAVLGELKKVGRRTIVIFQPHRYSRTKLLLSKFLTAFDKADILILTPIYPAGERPISGINGKVLFEALQKRRSLPTYYIPSRERIIQFVQANLRENDLVVTLGAGDITELSLQLIPGEQR